MLPPHAWQPPDPVPPAADLRDGLHPDVLHLPQSGIEEVVAHGRHRQGLIPLWVGEGDLPTPAFIVEEAVRSFRAGETFYTEQAGIPPLRAAIARYMALTYGSPFAEATREFTPERFFVTVGGMHAIQIAVRLVAGAGDDIVVPTPAWPNFAGAIAAAGAAVVPCPMTFEGHGGAGRWRIDIEGLSRAIGPRTRALVINSPSNPTGWVAREADLAALLQLARHHGLWIIADEIYGRFMFDGSRAPSFHDVMEPDDRILFAQTFSKNWAMTGWRIGWLEAPPGFGPTIESLVQYSTSGVPVPHQRAAIVALEQGEAFLAEQIARAGRSRDVLCAALGAVDDVRFAKPEGAFYLFCGLEHASDSRALALRLIDEAGVGVAPGSAFGAAGEGFVRLCFARGPADMVEVSRRLAFALGH